MKKKNSTRKMTALAKAEEVAKRAKIRCRLPSQGATDVQERKDAQFIQDKRKAKFGKKSGLWYPEIATIFAKYGFPNAFVIWDIKAESLKKAEEIAKWARAHGRIPITRAEDVAEKSAAVWIQNRKQAKIGKSLGRWYVEYDKIFAKYGFPNAFELRR